MGTVYLARDQRLGNTVALKETFFNDARMRKAFEREARLLAHLRHPALPKVIDHFSEDDGQFLVMEYIPGDDLEVLLAQLGHPFTPEKVLHLADQLLDALEYLHTQEEHPILHRDIKPANLKLTGRNQNQIILLDFGLAKGSIGQMTSIAQSKSVVGFTPNFAPLEQIQGTGTDPRSDLYALGATLYYLLTGVIPPNALERATAVISRRPDPLIPANEAAQSVPSAIAEVLQAAMSQSPDDRPATAEAMRIALQNAGRDSESTARSEAKTIVLPTPASGEYQGESVSSHPASFSDATRQDSAPRIVPTQRSDPRMFPSDGEVPQVEQSSQQELISSPDVDSRASANDSSPAMPTIVARYEPAPSFSPSVSDSAARPHSKRRFYTFGALGLLLLAIVSFGIYEIVSRSRSKSDAPKGKLTKLTNTGKASNPIISRDGKFVVYQVKESEQKSSIWRKNIDGGSDVQLVPPTFTGFGGFGRLTLTNDGSAILYSLGEYHEDEPSSNVLYQIPSSGGSPTRLIQDEGYFSSISSDGRRVVIIRSEVLGPDQEESTIIVKNTDGSGEVKLASIKPPDALGSMYGYSVELSPDGKQLAYTRTINSVKDDEQAGDLTLIVLNADGTGEKSVVTHKKKERLGGLVWSPDGKLIARINYPEEGEEYSAITIVKLDDGTEQTIKPLQWMYITSLGWSTDGKGLIVLGSDEGSDYSDIWQVSYPDGKVQLLNSGLEMAWGISVSDDGRILTSQSVFSSTLWVGASKDGQDAKQIASGQFRDLSWSPDGRILYSSKSGGNLDIWVMNADGSGQKQLSTDPRSDFSPVMTSDGRYVVFTSTRTGKPNIWRINADGSNPKQLTSANRDTEPDCTLDGRWVVYTSAVSGKRRIFKVSIDGGNPIQLTDKESSSPTISPDGNLIACNYQEDERSQSVSLIPLEGGSPTKKIENIYAWRLKWMPDGSGLTFISGYSSGGKEVVNHSSIMIQPIIGGERKELTKFPDVKGDDPFYPIGDHAWARDGRLAFTRDTFMSDLMMISDFK